MCVCVCVCTCMLLREYVCAWEGERGGECMCMHERVCVCVCMLVHMCACMGVCDILYLTGQYFLQAKAKMEKCEDEVFKAGNSKVVMRSSLSLSSTPSCCSNTDDISSSSVISSS